MTQRITTVPDESGGSSNSSSSVPPSTPDRQLADESEPEWTQFSTVKTAHPGLSYRPSKEDNKYDVKLDFPRWSLDQFTVDDPKLTDLKQWLNEVDYLTGERYLDTVNRTLIRGELSQFHLGMRCAERYN